MTKNQALMVIDNHKNKLIDPLEMLDWTWLRVIINEIPDDQWNKATDRAVVTLAR